MPVGNAVVDRLAVFGGCCGRRRLPRDLEVGVALAVAALAVAEVANRHDFARLDAALEVRDDERAAALVPLGNLAVD